jgi:hypothetical protein
MPDSSKVFASLVDLAVEA